MVDLKSKYISLHWKGKGILSIHNMAHEHFFKLPPYKNCIVKSNHLFWMRRNNASSRLKLSVYSLWINDFIPLELHWNISKVLQSYSIGIFRSNWLLNSSINFIEIDAVSVQTYFRFLDICSEINKLRFSILNHQL